MVQDAPSVFEAGRQLALELEEKRSEEEYDDEFEENGYSYGAAPIVPATRREQKVQYFTPAPKSQVGSRELIYEIDGKEKRSTDKKRKRHQVEELDLTAARRPGQEQDAIMDDAPLVLHSGLTGGLNRLLSKSKFPPSPDYSGGDGNEPNPLSVVKRTKHVPTKERGRASSTLVKIRKVRRTSDESRPRKHQRSHRHTEIVDAPKRRLKAIEYHAPRQEDSQQQLVVYRTRAELLMSFVTKGPESEAGCSMNKALKRYHRERGEQGLGLEKVEEEKELWKSLRLRRNERGEIVVFC